MKYLLALNGEPIKSVPFEVFQGVGMIRSEYLCRNREEYVTVKNCQEYIYEYVSGICKLFYPNPVWYRTTELVTPEINVLQGCDYEFEEKHYLLGLRGVRRGLKYPETFKTELSVISRISKEFNNLGILFPYIKDTNELKTCISFLEELEFKGKYGIMAEIPSTVVMIDDFVEMGISNITVGLNDLTTLTLGTYRGSEYHDHTHPAVLNMVKMCIEAGKKKNIPVSVAGYLTKEMESICDQIGVDNLIVHYSELNKIMNLDARELEHIQFLKNIKKLTKSRINEREILSWKKKLGV